MENNFPITERPVRISPIAWFLGIVRLVALAAISMFEVPLGTVGYAAFFMGSHLFMHGSHGGHGSHAGHEQRTAASANVDGPAGAAQSKPDEHAGHSGSCY